MSFCINCGKTVESRKRLLQNLCEDCHLKIHPLITVKKNKIPTISICPTCLSFKVFKNWESPHSQDLNNDILKVLNPRLDSLLSHPSSIEVDAISLEPDPFDLPKVKAKKSVILRFSAQGKVHPEFSSRSLTSELALKCKLETCTRCHNLRSQKHMAEITIVKKNKSFLPEEIQDNLSFISKIYEKQASSGPDYILPPKIKRNQLMLNLSSISLAKKIASYFRTEKGALTRESYKYKDQEKSRETRKQISILIRLLPFKVGDVLLHKNNPFLVEKIHEKTIECYDFSTESYKKVPTNTLFKEKILFPSNSLEEFLMVSIFNDTAQLMDSQFHIHELPIEKFSKSPPLKSKIKGFFYQDILYIVPSGWIS